MAKIVFEVEDGAWADFIVDHQKDFARLLTGVCHAVNEAGKVEFSVGGVLHGFNGLPQDKGFLGVETNKARRRRVGLIGQRKGGNGLVG